MKKGLLLYMLCIISVSLNAQKLLVFDENGKMVEYYQNKHDIITNYSFLIRESKKTDTLKFSEPKKNQVLFLIKSKDNGNEYFLNYEYQRNYSAPKGLLDDNVINFRHLGPYKNDTHFYLASYSFEGNNNTPKERILSYQILKFMEIEFIKNKLDTVQFIESYIKSYNTKNTSDSVLIDYAKLNKQFTEYLKVKLNLADQSKIITYQEKIKELKIVKSKLKADKYKKDIGKSSLIKKYKLEQKIKSYKTHFNTYLKTDDDRNKNSIATTDSILKWQNEIDSIDLIWKTKKYQDELTKVSLEKDIKKLNSELKIDESIKGFIKENKLNLPVISLLHQGLVKYAYTNDIDLVYSSTKSSIENKPYFLYDLSTLTKVSYLTYDSRMNTYITNQDSATYHSEQVFKMSVDMSTIGDEKDLVTGGWVQKLESVDFLPESISDGVESILPEINESIATIISGGGSSKGLNPKKYMTTVRSNNNIEYAVIALENVDYRDSTYNYFFISIDSINNKYCGIKIGNHVIDTVLNDSASYNKDIIQLINYIESSDVNKKFTWMSKDLFSNKMNTLKVFFNAALKANTLSNNSFIQSLITDLKCKVFTNSNTYYDTEIHTQDGFKAVSKPVVTIKTSSFDVGEKSFIVNNNRVIKKSDYTFTLNPSKSIIATNLPLVRKKYRFAITAGLAFTGFTNYEYDIVSLPEVGTTTPTFVRENVFTVAKLVPTVFFSWYPCQFDVYSKLKRNWYKRFELGVGIDYQDKNLIDNLYLGAGWTPHRLVHIIGGVRFGETTRLNYDKLDLYNVTNESVVANYETRWSVKPTGFVAINLGIDIIPSAIKLIFK